MSELTPPIPFESVKGDVTRILDELRGSGAVDDRIVEWIYSEMRHVASRLMLREPAGHTLQPTALVNEAWLRLGDQCFENRRHFFSAAAQAMRRILVEHARRKQAQCRGGDWVRMDYSVLENLVSATGGEENLLCIHEALTRFEQHDPQKAELVRLRYFAGMTGEAVARLLNKSLSTVNRDWAYARAWLYRELSRSDGT
ncbi:MAG: RNA polymerase subunit sigma [Verrucomicrobiales bacterium]|nr:RNA polymerase subunit sigma [Verrucomicrobiales bacterium]|tara:strand:+ start:262 stop:858 length:597 start_codon:yes stop_codon:yes gene_type:complete